jgi:hypothetical protein
VTLEHRREEIKEYFKNWVIDSGSHHLKIIKFLKDHKDLSDTNTKDNAWLDTYDLVHQEAFQTPKPIIKNPTVAKAFLGVEADAVRRFVLEWEKERYGDLGGASIETDILDDVALVNRYFFIHGEDIVEEWMEDPINY